MGGADQASFQVSGATLQFRAGTTLDYETKSSYAVTVRSADQGGLTYDRALTITLTDANDTPRLTAPGAQTITLATPTALTGISVADQDAGTASLSVTLAASAGTLAATSSSGVTVTGTGSAQPDPERRAKRNQQPAGRQRCQLYPGCRGQRRNQRHTQPEQQRQRALRRGRTNRQQDPHPESGGGQQWWRRWRWRSDPTDRRQRRRHPPSPTVTPTTPTEPVEPTTPSVPTTPTDADHTHVCRPHPRRRRTPTTPTTPSVPVDPTPTTPTVPTPPVTPTIPLVDGVAITRYTRARPDGGTVNALTIPVISSERQDQDSSSPQADIALAVLQGQTLLKAEVPTGIGMTVEDLSDSPSRRTDLLDAIKSRTTAQLTDQNQMLKLGQTFLASLPSSTDLWVRTVIISTESSQDATGSLVFRGQTSDSHTDTALVLDFTHLPTNSTVSAGERELCRHCGPRVGDHRRRQPAAGGRRPGTNPRPGGR